MSEAMQEGALAFAQRIASNPSYENSLRTLPIDVRVTLALLLAAVLEARGELPVARSA